MRRGQPRSLRDGQRVRLTTVNTASSRRCSRRRCRTRKGIRSSLPARAIVLGLWVDRAAPHSGNRSHYPAMGTTTSGLSPVPAFSIRRRGHARCRLTDQFETHCARGEFAKDRQCPSVADLGRAGAAHVGAVGILIRRGWASLTKLMMNSRLRWLVWQPQVVARDLCEFWLLIDGVMSARGPVIDRIRCCGSLAGGRRAEVAFALGGELGVEF